VGLEVGAIISLVSAAIPALIGAGKMLFPPSGASSGDVSAAGARKMADMQKAASAYGAYRPDQADARMKGLQHQLSAFQGAGNIMQAMYGGTGIGGGGGYTPGKGGFDPSLQRPGSPTNPSPDPTGTPPPPGWKPSGSGDWYKPGTTLPGGGTALPGGGVATPPIIIDPFPTSFTGQPPPNNLIARQLALANMNRRA
jgi:hypothetical protein